MYDEHAVPFTFEDKGILGPEMSNKSIFEKGLEGSNLIESVLQGMNATIFAYGQTSSGKTFTLRGGDSAPGLIPLSINTLFGKLPNL